MLKRLMGIFSRTGGPVDLDAVVPGGKEGGHGDHWGCVLRTVDEARLVRYLVDITKQDNEPERFGKDGLAFISEAGPVRARVLVRDNVMVSAYPDAAGGAVWPITVYDVVQWSNGVEAQILGECRGAAVRFFDTRYYANRDRYTPGETYDFHMGALAYKIGPAGALEAHSPDVGAAVSFKGAHAYMPADDPGADIDDIWFHSPLEGAPVAAQLAGQVLSGYPVIIALPEDFQMSLVAYAAPHALPDDPATIRPGDDITGYLWLHGCLAE
ncbi:MAG TPA: hypothetical protein VFR15_07225 [Chloroflexia bacterium]|nr:hypothetical protein [Chloroflexia bacterium]